jgi:hypothetical protein
MCGTRLLSVRVFLLDQLGIEQAMHFINEGMDGNALFFAKILIRVVGMNRIYLHVDRNSFVSASK